MNLPKTAFPMRARLATREQQWLDFWAEKNIYNRAVENRKGSEPYILHDGPPYANGHIHMGTAFNKVIKDVIVKYKTMGGHYSPYVPGWDCHGQPIEHQIQKELGKERMEKTSKSEIRRLCKDYALKYVDIQREEFKRLGVLGDWDNPYLTLTREYEVGNIEVFKRLYLDGSIYRGRKAVHWCIEDETVLAEAEIEYADETSSSIFVAFELNEKTPWDSELGGEKANILIWTTTAWTLPANAFVIVNGDAEYAMVRADGRNLIIASDLVESVAEIAGWETYSVTELKVKGSELTHLSYKHPIIDERSANPIIADPYVDLSTGTGAVHGAGGHGAEDNALAVKHNLPIYMPVDEKGYFDKGGGPFEGNRVRRDDKKIIEWLDSERGTLVAQSSITHSYPHCWRCKNPVIFRATEQWFVSMEKTGLREKAIQNLDNINWIPAWSRNRMGAMIADRPDWAISRQRTWGVPIPVHHCKDCGSVVATEESFDAIIDLISREGADAWYTREPSEYLPEGLSCTYCGCSDLVPEQDILDVWWESGVSHISVLEKRPELSRPANLYLEGTDQHRGWFQSSYLTSLGYDGSLPFKDLMTCGFVVDGSSRKMSKSLGNVVAPEDIIKVNGADIVRLWTAMTDYSNDMSISDEIISRVSDTYRRIRNSFRFLLSNLEDFAPENMIAYEDLLLVDKAELIRLGDLVKTVTKNNDEFHFYASIRAISDYLGEISSAYLDALKDRLYSEAPNSAVRRSAQTVLAEILLALVKMVAPVLAFTAEEVWSFIPEALKPAEDSVHLSDWPVLDLSAIDTPKLRAQMDALKVSRDLVTKALEDARNEGRVGKSQEAAIRISAPQDLADVLEALGSELLSEFFIVSTVEVLVDGALDTGVVEVLEASGEKCPRCWNFRKLGLDSTYPDVCERCAKALHEIGFEG